MFMEQIVVKVVIFGGFQEVIVHCHKEIHVPHQQNQILL